MKKYCFILLDTNICIYRTLAYAEPRILKRDDLDKVTDKIDMLTNNNFSCKIIISDTISSELMNNEILFWEVSQFCINKLHYKPNSYQTLQIFEKSKKSINKFLIKYGLANELRISISKHHLNLRDVDNFYLSFPERLMEITLNKLNNLKPFQRNKKLSERPNNLPEENDRLLLCEAIELKKNNENDIYIFSNDSDFTKFETEINKKFGIKILKLDDAIEKED